MVYHKNVVGLRDSAVKALIEAGRLIEVSPELITEEKLINDMAVMVVGYQLFTESDFDGMTEEACELFTSVIDYVDFLKRKKISE